MNNMYDISGSIVVFKNNRDLLEKAFTSFFNTRLNTYLYVIDNSPTDDLRGICNRKNVEYIFNNDNLGFGAGHNIAIRKMMDKAKYSLIFNPDVYFYEGTLEKLFSFMEKNPGFGSIMPKVLFPDGSLQYLCRLLPDLCDIILRKINIKILSPFINQRKFRYELRFADYNKIMEVPYLSGCFMFVRTDVFKKIGMFDERFFVYFEDVDLSRRIHKIYRTVYYPEAVVYHRYERGSNKNVGLLGYLISSGFKYFNKWGWFFDDERKFVNDSTLRNLRSVYNEGPDKEVSR